MIWFDWSKSWLPFRISDTSSLPIVIRSSAESPVSGSSPERSGSLVCTRPIPGPQPDHATGQNESATATRSSIHQQNLTLVRRGISSGSSRQGRNCHRELLFTIHFEKTFWKRSSTNYAPVLWNDLPLYIRKSDSLSSFKTSLKTHLFRKQFGS